MRVGTLLAIVVPTTAILVAGCSSTTPATTASTSRPAFIPERSATSAASPTAAKTAVDPKPTKKPRPAPKPVTLDSAVAEMSGAERKAFCKKVTSTPTQVIDDLKEWTGKGAGGAIAEAYSVCSSYGL